jgi:cation transport ATPase
LVVFESNEINEINEIIFPSYLFSSMIAALGMSFSSVSVIGNALRLKQLKLGDEL